ncbi:MAG: nucleotidyltransferase domain-containing protein [Defluviitaleaceae bacterium]|nr:nucleotidyltransferase domain-containing protein [Defluviitaleaceae bacterium]
MDPNIVKSIMEKLKETEETHQVKIPLAIESGSRGWGFAAANADYDCRFIYVHKRDWYLSVQEKKDFIEYPVDEIFDIRGYDLSRALKYIMKSQATILEYLSSNVGYIRNNTVIGKLQTLAIDFFNPIPVSYHYLNLARNMLKEVTESPTAKIKKYFYILRPVANLNYIWQYNKMPYMEYAKTLEAIDPDLAILDAINELKALKASSLEHDLIPMYTPLIGYFQSEIETFDQRLKTMKHEKNKNYDLIDDAFRSIIEDVWQ